MQVTDLAWKRFCAKVTIDENGCCVWTGCVSRRHGYGRVTINRTTYDAHLVAWNRLVGPVPTGLCIDHLCRNRRCVNIWHARVVTNRINVLAGTGFAAEKARQTSCTRGHPFDDLNTYRKPSGQRQCRACTRRRAQQRRAA